MQKRLLHESGDYSDTKRKGKEEERLQNRRKDHISHFILRLAFSRTYGTFFPTHGVFLNETC